VKRWTVDCSTAIKLFVHEEQSEDAPKWLNHHYRHVVPDLFYVETASVLWKRIQRGELSRLEVQRIRKALLVLPCHVVSGRQLYEAALDLSLAFNHSAYDCMYLAAAIASDAPLVTADRKFHQVVKGSPLGAHIRWIEEVP
jgi:predicted nucleic acid-binding protein